MQKIIKLFLILLITVLAASTLFASESLPTKDSDDCDSCYDFPDEFFETKKTQKYQSSLDEEVHTPPAGYSDIIIIFSAQNCSYCKFIENTEIPKLAEKEYKKVFIKTFYLNNPENYEKFYYLLRNKEIEDKMLPVLVSEQEILSGKEAITKGLENLVKKNSKIIKLTVPSDTEIKKDITNKFKSMTALVVVSAGLIDGINPCAFGTIIFLITYLSVSGFRRRQVLLSGLSFALGVFTLYFLIGIGLYDIFTSVFQSQFAWFRYIKNILAVLMLILFLLSLYDIFLYFKRRRSDDMMLILPEKFRASIHKFIRLYSKKSFSIILSFLLGFIISIIELACTGQVYFPTIMYLIKDQSYRYKAISYLLVYNLAFILPLVLVFLAIFFGISIKSVEKKLREKVWIIKILLALLFFSMFLIFLLN